MWQTLLMIVGFFVKRAMKKQEKHDAAIEYQRSVDDQFIKHVAVRQKYANYLRERLNTLDELGVKPDDE